MAANIVWLASYPKSGNTWLRAFLLHLFTNAQERRPLDELAAMSTFDSAVMHFNAAAGEVRPAWTEEETAAWRGRAQRELAKRFAATSFVKTHSAFVTWRGHPMFDMSVTAGAIYIVRNPLDVVASVAAAVGDPLDEIVTMMNTAGFVWPASRPQVPQLIGSWSENVTSWTAQPNPALHVMRYEDMVERPHDTFAALAAFLKLDPPAERLERALRLSSFDSLREGEEAAGFQERGVSQQRFFRSGRVGGWRDELTRDQAQAIVDGHRAQMSRFDYVPEGF
jgi:hypothetical protein